MRTIIILLLCFTSFLIFAQKEGKFVDYYDTGELKVEGQYENNKREGAWKDYHKNGQVSRENSYKEGKLEKEAISYYETGIKSSETKQVNNQYIRYGYFETGELKHERNLDTGNYKSFYKDGAINVEANYENNEIVGIWKKHYRNGNLEWQVNYVDGYREGAFKKFYENGDIMLEGKMHEDKINGEEKRYAQGNILQWKGYYKMGELAKTWTHYNDKGKAIKKVKIKNQSKYLDTLKPTEVIEGVDLYFPIFPGCTKYLNNTGKKKCMNTEVQKNIMQNFNTNLATTLGLSPGIKRIYVMFKIDLTGESTDIKARAPHPALEKEAIRVINLLPTMQPGTSRKKKVVIPFSIPIVFAVKR